MSAPPITHFPYPPAPPDPPKDVQIPTGNAMFQSGYINLQVAGSTDSAALGPDGSSRGFHLRWDFSRILREQHIAKGDLATTPPYDTTIGFNKANDYVRIYRAPYTPRYAAAVEIKNGVSPTTIINAGPTREWKYTVQTVPGVTFISPPLPAEFTTIIIRFDDIAQYDTIRNSGLGIDPTTNARDFIKAYKGMIEVEAEDKLMYATNIDTDFIVGTVAAKKASFLKAESISVPDSLENEQIISNRVHYVGPDPPINTMHSNTLPLPPSSSNPANRVRMVADNIKYVRFIYSNSFPIKLELECYRDFIIGTNRQGITPANPSKGSWTRVQDLNGKDFSLTIDNIEAYVRLYNPKLTGPSNLGTVHAKWPKYNDVDASTGACAVNGLNYIERWDPAMAPEKPNGLLEAVKTYLTESKTDVKAEVLLPSTSQTPPDFTHLKTGFLDLLRTVGLDFHVARMLGLGHIDDPAPVNNNDNLFVYVAEYVTAASLLTDVPGEGPIQNAPNLGVAGQFSVLGNSGVTGSTGAGTVVTGDVGSSPTAVISNFPPSSVAPPFTLHLTNDATVQQAMADAIAAYNFLAAQGPGTVLPGQLDGQVLTTGIYSFAGGTADLAALGTLTLNGPGVFIFQVDSALTMNVGSNVIGTADPCNVYWRIGTSGTLNGINTRGIFIADGNILIGDGSNVQGKVLAGIGPTGSVTMVGAGGNTIGGCSVVPGNVTHLYMAPLIARKHFRHPTAPVLDSLSFGLKIENGTQEPTLITDIFGYSQFDDSRFVNLNKKPFELEVPFEPFFARNDEFALINTTKPVMFGVEYRGLAEPNFRKPEISSDEEFLDTTFRPETVPILEQPNPFFVHQEKEEGSHVYACYAINWFSRPSPVSNSLPTDFTLFPDRKKLLPPINLAVQLIQEEDPRILTTGPEQQLLLGINTPDKTLVRTTFDWNHTHNIAHEYATYAEIFFRENVPMSTRGKILSVSAPNNLHEVMVTTTPFLIASSNGGQTVQPHIPPGLEDSYRLSLLTTNQRSYVIKSISGTVDGNNPSFLISQIRETTSNDPNNTNHFTTTEQFISPQVGEIFMAVENLNNPFNWTSMMKRKIGLVKFSTDDDVKVSNSQTNNGDYKVVSVVFSPGNSYITVKEKIPSDISPLGDLTFNKTVPILSVDQPNGIFIVKGDVLVDIMAVGTFNVLLSDENDGSYNVVSAAPSGAGANTEITVSSIPSSIQFGNVIFEKTLAVDSIDLPNNRFVVNGDISAELIPSHKETFIQDDGSQVELNIGGVYEQADITHYFYPDSPNGPTGIYKIKFTTYQLPDHPDDRDKYEVQWHKGIVRVPTSPVTPDKKVLQVLDINNSGTTLELLVFDPDFNVSNPPATIDQVIPPGGVPGLGDDSVTTFVNFHPSYRTYFAYDDSLNPNTGNPNNFTEPVILPGIGQGIKQTLMAIRSVDTTRVIPLESAISTPVPLIAREIVKPEKPGDPIGPIFATRPDFYGKSTYTFDVKVSPVTALPDPRRPFSMVFYRCNERKILDTLYKPDTVEDIIEQLATLQSPDADFINSRWNDLVNMDYDVTNGTFKEYTPGGFVFPLPDNADYKIPLPPPETTIPAVKPFAPVPGYADLNSTIQYFDGVGNVTFSIADIAKEAILGAFLPLMEQPATYRFIKGGHKTSAKKPLYKNLNGELILPIPALDPSYDPDVFDPFPMVVQYAKNSGDPSSFFTDKVNLESANNEIYIRFTDYTLDGASTSIYFYFAMELSNTSKFGPPSGIVGPVRLVNAFPAEQPGIKKTITQLSNAILGIPTAVAFELNEYVESENIRKFQIFRATTPQDALSTRTMTLAKTVDAGDDVIDDFSDLPIPLYGDPLYYRIVALREIVNEQSATEFIPSKPSNLVLTNIVDNINPAAPQLSYVADPPTGSPLQINNVALNWPKTAHNATYHLYKMNASGNWVKIHAVVSNADTITVLLSATDLLTGTLFKQDADLNTIYHRFRVQVVNSSGLLNLTNNELTI